MSAAQGATVPLRAVSVEELLAKDIKPREMLLAPILPEQGLVMIYSYRGIGKTFIALGIGFAVATGGKFLCWTAPRPRSVLYIDGELPAKTLQDRCEMILVGMIDAKLARQSGAMLRASSEMSRACRAVQAPAIPVLCAACR